jgi:hypothetical protein
MALNPKVTQIIQTGTKAQRVYACERSFPHFAIYYFTEYFTYKSAGFHWDFYDDCQKLVNGTLKEAAWIAFRESAKTSIAKIFVIWCILYRKKKYINYDSYDKSNSEAALFDIAVSLQTNKKILSDFGALYYPSKQKSASGDIKEAKIKRISNFITENKVKVEAFSTQEPIRGRIYQNQRPDLVIFDDIESNRTKDSYPLIIKIREHIDECRSGIPEEGSILYLGNYITEDGVIAYVMDNLKGRDNAVVRNVPVIIEGKPTWEEKYAITDEEALLRNKDKETGKRVISLETKKRDLTPSVFETEMMNNPAKAGDNVFDRAVMDVKKKNCSEPKNINAGFKTWFDYVPTHRYGIGADTAEGIGRDSCASVVIDFSTNPNRVVATYESSVIPPDLFGYELIRQGGMYGKCILAPEINNTGYATVAILGENYDEDKIFHHTTKDKITNQEIKKLGWHTNSSTKPSAIYELKSAVEDGMLEIYDQDLLEEMSHYQIRDLKTSVKKPGMTRHFDKLIACAIAWQLRDDAVPDYQPQIEQQVEMVRRERKNEFFNV